jgi:hypothetical protein
MQEPFLYQGNDPVDWSFGQLVRMVEDVRSIGCLDTLVTEADRAGVKIPIPPEAINFVKTFLFHGGFHKAPDKTLAESVAAPQAVTASAARPLDAAAAADIARDVIRSAHCGGRPPVPPGGPPVFPPPGPGEVPPM